MKDDALVIPYGIEQSGKDVVDRESGHIRVLSEVRQNRLEHVLCCPKKIIHIFSRPIHNNPQDTAMEDKIKAVTYHATKCSDLLHRFTCRSQRIRVPDSRGVTLVELVVVIGILGVLALMAMPSYNGYMKTVKNNACASDIRIIDKAVTAYFIDRNVLPPSLEAAGMGDQLDPWKRPYEYKILDGVNVPQQDIGAHDLNHDFDLYSKGEDGASSPLFGEPENDDDISRANDGAFVGGRP